MPNAASFSTFVRPPGSPIYSPAGPSLVLPRRSSPSTRSQRVPAEVRGTSTAETRRQVAQLLALIRATEAKEQPRSISKAQNEEVARSLQQLELKLGERERAAEEREFRVAERERDLAEAEALVRHREALLKASRKRPSAKKGISEVERVALLNLKAELDRQEAQLRESREALRERERFIEESESRLFEKVQEHQEKETELEQREEDLKLRSAKKSGGAGVPEKKAIDEFTE